MMHAMNLAKIASQKSEVPVGAIIVKNGEIIGEGLKSNHTILGIHTRGNDGEVDPKGFIDIGSTIHPHPTLSETFAMAAEAFEGTITDLYMPKKKSKTPSKAA